MPEVAFDVYNEARGGADRQVRQRAMLYSELELAKWLLHGTELRSTEIVDDAVDLLTSLADSVRRDVMHPIGAADHADHGRRRGRVDARAHRARDLAARPAADRRAPARDQF